LQLFRYAAQLDGTADDIAVLKQYGVPYEVLDRAGCVAAGAGTSAVQDKIAGRVRLPQDETGDCHMFTQRSRSRLKSSACALPSMSGSRTDRGCHAHYRRCHFQRVLQADAYVTALGSWSPRLLRPLGISLPVYPVKGYSITVPISDPEGLRFPR